MRTQLNMIYFLIVLVVYPSVHSLNDANEITMNSNAFKAIPIVETKLGTIRGLNASDGEYCMYLGVPYARINESNPFGPSIPYQKYENVVDAFDDSVLCPQLEEYNNTITGTLNCLHLNIYVPRSATKNNPLPVLVMIFGGGGRNGLASRYVYGPKFLVKHNIIFIAINYRLGPYGFMCLDIPEASGNEGLKDQMKALQWIRSNIADFGGDIDKVTLYGGSSGAGDTELHLQHEDNNFIDKIILGSASSTAPWYFVKPDKQSAVKLANDLGCSTSDTYDALLFLKTVEPLKLIKSVHKLNIIFGPCIEKKIQGVAPYVTEHPITDQILKVNLSAILLSNDNEECAFVSDTFRKDTFTQEKTESAFEEMKGTFNFDSVMFERIKPIIRPFYIKDEVDGLKRESRQGMRNFHSDLYFLSPIERSTQMYLEKGVERVYRQLFTYAGNRNYIRKLIGDDAGKGAGHADEIGYLFDISYMNKTITAEDQLMIDRITLLWTNFVKYGDPTPRISELLPVKWTPVTKDALTYLMVGRNLTLGTRPFRRRMAFWDLIVEVYHDCWNKGEGLDRT